VGSAVASPAEKELQKGMRGRFAGHCACNGGARWYFCNWGETLRQLQVRFPSWGMREDESQLAWLKQGADVEQESMNSFERRIATLAGEGLRSRELRVMQVNIGLKCNQQCAHCHLSASPYRTETMQWSVMELVLRAANEAGAELVDITGGSPELNPHFRRFVEALRAHGHKVKVRTNLTVLLEPGMEDIPQFYRDNQVHLVASLPCYTEENVRVQRGGGVYSKSVEVLKRLNALGYGSDADKELDLVYNPTGPFLPSDQASLEADYKRELDQKFDISFSHLITITNMPIGRFLAYLKKKRREGKYMELLEESFNRDTIEGLMCRYQISVGWDGTIYDCDFNLALGFSVNHGAPTHIRDFDAGALAERRIVTGDHCFGCTAGRGSSCSGALA